MNTFSKCLYLLDKLFAITFFLHCNLFLFLLLSRRTVCLAPYHRDFLLFLNKCFSFKSLHVILAGFN